MSKRALALDDTRVTRLKQSFPHTYALFTHCVQHPNSESAQKLLAMYQELAAFVSSESDSRAERMAQNLVSRLKRGLESPNSVDAYILHIVYLEREISARKTVKKISPLLNIDDRPR